MSFINIIKVQTQRDIGETIGFVSSPVYKVYDAQLEKFFWAVDIDLQQASTNPNVSAFTPLKAVPIDDPSREVFDADLGTQVRLKRRVGDQRYVVTGLTKFAPGTLSICLVQISENAIIVNDPATYGINVRLLTYDELGTLYTYGDLPYGTAGKFDLNGTLLQLLPPQ